MDKDKGIVKMIREFLSGNDKPGKIQILLVLILVGVLLVTFVNGFSKPKENGDEVFKSNQKESEAVFFAENDLERLESVLSEVKGVGKVKVMITYKNSGANIYAKDVSQTLDSEEQRSSDGKTVTKKNEDMESSLVFSGQKTPVLEDKKTADVKGVLVVAEGAEDPSVRSQILNAVQVLTGVQIHEIAVCTYK